MMPLTMFATAMDRFAVTSVDNPDEGEGDDITTENVNKNKRDNTDNASCFLGELIMFRRWNNPSARSWKGGMGKLKILPSARLPDSAGSIFSYVGERSYPTGFSRK